MKYTQIPATTFEQIQLNAGILVKTFTPSTGVVGDLLGATTGGVNFKDTLEFIDFGEDIDNCPKNMMELKKLDSHEVTMSGTFVTVSAELAKMLAGVADVDSQNSAHIIPRNDVLTTDFTTLWWIGDYSDVNTGADAGFIAIKLINALNTDGFQIQSTDKGKGQFAFNFTGHYSMSAQDTVPYEIWVQEGASSSVPSIDLNTHYVSMVDESTELLVATVRNSSSTVTWTSSNTAKATVADGLVTAKDAGSCIITASITDNGVTYSDTCTIVVTA